MHESKWTLRIEVSTNLPDYFTEKKYDASYSMHAKREAPLWDMSNWIGNVGVGMLCGGGGCLSGGMNC